ncbi:hypothetical protein BKA70DRAFT_1516670 [Coprinopsis sp. MPI-PUGE-AT-0042]|nr:hypothetical protein BKA70DRAFT_1516670 [Coprinopsis sp. MPI-PUGE-AT-0042]
MGEGTSELTPQVADRARAAAEYDDDLPAHDEEDDGSDKADDGKDDDEEDAASNSTASTTAQGGQAKGGKGKEAAGRRSPAVSRRTTLSNASLSAPGKKTLVARASLASVASRGTTNTTSRPRSSLLPSVDLKPTQVPAKPVVVQPSRVRSTNLPLTRVPIREGVFERMQQRRRLNRVLQLPRERLCPEYQRHPPTPVEQDGCCQLPAPTRMWQNQLQGEGGGGKDGKKEDVNGERGEEEDYDGVEDGWIRAAASRNSSGTLKRVSEDVIRACESVGGTLGAIATVLKACLVDEYLKAKILLRDALNTVTKSTDNHLRALILE